MCSAGPGMVPTGEGGLKFQSGASEAGSSKCVGEKSAADARRGGLGRRIYSGSVPDAARLRPANVDAPADGST